MRKVIKPGNLVPSEEVVQIPDAPTPQPLESQEIPISEATPSDPLPELETQDKSRQILESKTLEQVQDVSHKILQSARIEREKILSQAQEEAEKIRTEARQTAYRQVLDEKHGEIERCLSEVDRLMNDLQEQHQSFIKQYEDGLFSLSLDIAEKVLHTAIGEQEELMRSLVKEAVSSVKNVNWISVQVSDRLPGLVEALQKEFANWKELCQVEVSAADLPIGGCVVQTPDGVVDASISVQLGNLKGIFDKSKE